jgi:hypothetical protein
MATPSNASYKLPKISNEPNLHYKPDSPERAALVAELKAMEAAAPYYVPAFVNGKEVSSLQPASQRSWQLTRFRFAGSRFWPSVEPAHAPQARLDPCYLLYLLAGAHQRGYRVGPRRQVGLGEHAFLGPRRHLPQGEFNTKHHHLLYRVV